MVANEANAHQARDQENSELNSLLINRNFQTGLLIGLEYSRQSIRNHIWQIFSTNCIMVRILNNSFSIWYGITWDVLNCQHQFNVFVRINHFRVTKLLQWTLPFHSAFTITFGQRLADIWWLASFQVFNHFHIIVISYPQKVYWMIKLLMWDFSTYFDNLLPREIFHTHIMILICFLSLTKIG